jgi:hypothetical protein
MKSKLKLICLMSAALISLPLMTALAAPLPAGIKLGISQGVGSSVNLPCASGSCFSMEVAPGFVIWTDFGPGTDAGFIVGKSQKCGTQEFGSSSANTTPSELTNAWLFSSNYGTFCTDPGGEQNIFDDAGCTSAGCLGKTELKYLYAVWNGTKIPLGSSGGCVHPNCSADQKAGIFVTNYQINPVTGGTWSIAKNAVVPEEMPGFAGLRFQMTLRGDVTIPVIPIPITIAADDVGVGGYAEPNDIVMIWFPNITNSGTGIPVCRISAPASYQNNYAVVANDCLWGAYVNNSYPYYFEDRFTYQACNDTSCDTGTVTVYALTSHTVPRLANLDMLLTTEQDKSVNWLPSPTRNARIDPSTLLLSYTIVSQPKHGTATAPTATASGVYTPSEGYVGSDYFEYRMSSNQTSSSNGLVAITVNSPAVHLIAGAVTIDGLSGKLTPWTPLVTSSVSTPAPTCVIEAPPSNGNATVSADCSSGTYLSNPGFIGIDSFVYRARVCPDQCYDASATVTVAVTEPPPTEPCLAQYHVSQFTQTGKQGTLSVTFTGNITSHTNKEVKICPGTTLRYTASSTKDLVKCKVKNSLSSGSGTLRIQDHLKCTDKPGGRDKVQFKVKSGVSQ